MIAATSTIEFDEFDRTGRVVALSNADAVALANTELLEVLPVRTGRWRLVPNGAVGAVRLGSRSITVLPHANLGVSQLFFLLDYAPGDTFLKSSIGATTTDDLWTSLARSLVALAEPELARGLLRGYRRVDDALTTVRGRIRISDQLRRRPGMAIPLEVTYSEFTPNIAENQILRTALHRMQFLPGLADSVRRELAQLSFRLADVDIIAHGQPVPEWVPSRLNARFYDALQLAERIVNQVWLDIDPDSESSTLAAFVTTMPVLFERFVAEVLSEAITADEERLLRDSVAYLDSNGAAPGGESTAADSDLISVQTGLVYERRGKPVATFVPSYPSTRNGTLADHYRILAACTALGVNHAYLVYPADRRGAMPRPRHIVHTDISITEYPIDLAAGPEAARATLATLAAEARTLGSGRKKGRQGA